MTTPKQTEYSEHIQRAREILMLPERTSYAEVKEAYHRLSRAHHPDHVNPHQQEKATEEMKAINHAYAVLREFFFNYPVDLTSEAARNPAFNPEAWWKERFAGSYWQDDD